MGRPREHDEHTAAALLRAAERTIQDHGPDALSVRGIATEVGTSTRAVYSLFGSKEGLIAALGAHAFDLLRSGLDDLATTDDPGRRPRSAAGLMFRRFATEHPSLFAIGVQRSIATPRLWEERVRPAAERALTTLKSRVYAPSRRRPAPRAHRRRGDPRVPRPLRGTGGARTARPKPRRELGTEVGIRVRDPGRRLRRQPSVEPQPASRRSR